MMPTGTWYRWFAWRPVLCQTASEHHSVWVWLCWVQRRRIRMYGSLPTPAWFVHRRLP